MTEIFDWLDYNDNMREAIKNNSEPLNKHFTVLAID